MKYKPTVSGAKVTSQVVSGALMGGSVSECDQLHQIKKKKKHLQHFQLVPRLVAQFYLPYNQPEMAKAHCLTFS